MARFTVHLEKTSKKLVVNVQSDLLDELGSRLVIPMIPLSEAHKPVKKLNPVLEFEGKKVVLLTHQMAAVSVGNLKPAMASLESAHTEIFAAIDCLLQGI
jgi:toxin CcdB